MRLLVDDKDLQLLLEKKRDLIGNKVTIDMIIAGVSFICDNCRLWSDARSIWCYLEDNIFYDRRILLCKENLSDAEE